MDKWQKEEASRKEVERLLIEENKAEDDARYVNELANYDKEEKKVGKH